MDVYILKVTPEAFGEKMIEVRDILRNTAKQELLKKATELIQLEYDLRKVFNMSAEHALKNAMYLSNITKYSYEDFSYFAECMSISKPFGIPEILDSLQNMDGFYPTKQVWDYHTKVYYWLIDGYYCIQIITLQQSIKKAFINIPYVQRYLDNDPGLETYNRMISAKLSDGIEINCSFTPDFFDEELISAKPALTKEQRALRMIQKDNYNSISSTVLISSKSLCNQWQKADSEERNKILINEIIKKLPDNKWEDIVTELVSYEEDLEY